MENPYYLISELLGEIENRRTQDVIRRRFGLVDGRAQTLQEIGDQYNITRERVRQIENGGIAYLTQSKILAKIKPIEDEMYDYFKQNGELRREQKAFDDLICLCLPASPKLQRGEPASQIEEMRRKNDAQPALCQAAINLILTLAESFERLPETDEFHPVWTINKNAIKKARKTVDSAAKYFDKQRQLLKEDELYNVVKKNIPDVSDKAVSSYIDASKLIDQNHFGQFGLVVWPEVSPRGVRDKAYLIFKKEGNPFHFSEITDLINQELPQSRPAYVQTVHNELIKDPRFVLIGRGIYALNEWGYEPGTVVDVIRGILKEKGPLSREEIIKSVMEKRLIKENTILINLQNKKIFRKLEDGRFALA